MDDASAVVGADEGEIPPSVFGDEDESPSAGVADEGGGGLSGLRSILPRRRRFRRINHLDDEGKIRRAGMVQDQSLRKWYARLLLLGMAAQVIFANVIFWRYSTAAEWKMPSEVVIAWLSGTVVEIIGLVLIITRSLFPPGKDEAPVPDSPDPSVVDS